VTPWRQPWPRGALYGALWGIAVVFFEATMPIGGGTIAEGWAPRVVGSLLVVWMTRGIAIAWIAQWLAPRVHARTAWAAFAALTLIHCVAWDSLDTFTDLAERWLALQYPVRGNFFYTLWLQVTYGAPLFAFCLFGERVRRVQDVLASAEVARARSAADLARARLESLSQRIDPELLLRALGVARHEIASHAPRAQSLLDDLAAFLRMSMPGLRSGQSSVSAELSVLRLHSRLMERIDAGAVPCHIEIDAGVPEDQRFPPHLLVPLVEAARSARDPGAQPIRLSLTASGRCVKLRLRGPQGGDWLPAALEYRMTRHFDAAEVADRHLGPDSDAALEWSFPLDRFGPTLQGDAHG
jgi:hypothetical protein